MYNIQIMDRGGGSTKTQKAQFVVVALNSRSGGAENKNKHQCHHCLLSKPTQTPHTTAINEELLLVQ